MFALGNATFACGVRSARERSFEEASGETEVERLRLSPPLALAPRTHPGTQTKPQLKPATSAGVILPETGKIPVVMLATVVATTATLLSNSCKSARFFSGAFLLPFYGNSSPRTIRFLGKRTVTSECHVEVWTYSRVPALMGNYGTDPRESYG